MQNKNGPLLSKEHELIMMDDQIADEDFHTTISPNTGSKEKLIVQKKKKEYVQSFSVHGLTKICLGTRSESIFWSVMLLIGITISTTVIYRLVSKYLKYEIYTEVYEKKAFKNTFPSITFCNEFLSKDHYFTYCGKQGGSSSMLHEPCNQVLRPHQPKVNQIKQNPKEWSNGYFHVTYCKSWGSIYCANDQHLQSLTKHNHTCFIWNYNGDFHDAYGHVAMEFKINTSENVVGKIAAYTHDSRIEELDVTNRLIIDPSTTYELTIRKTSIKRLPEPFPSKCVEKFHKQFFPGKYSRRMCIDSLNYINMYKKCGDIMDYHKPFIPTEIVKKYSKNATQRETMACFIKESYEKVSLEVTNQCPFPCEEMNFHTTANLHGIRDIVKSDDGGPANTYMIEIQLQSVDSYQVIEEKQLYSWDQVLGEVGGLLGLVIGASILSFVEILAYAYLCLMQKCAHFWTQC